MIVHVDCPNCSMENSFEMAQYTEKSYLGAGADNFTVAVYWDVNTQKCECEFNQDMCVLLPVLANEQATMLSFDDSGDEW